MTDFDKLRLIKFMAFNGMELAETVDKGEERAGFLLGILTAIEYVCEFNFERKGETNNG